MFKPKYFIAAASAAVLAFNVSELYADEKPSSHYEDDAWYDVSEWFDGNDYNPTDEAVGRWDDETYDAKQDTGGDQDNDINGYGYNKPQASDANNNVQNDWFYDYYNPPYFPYYGWNAARPYSTYYYDYDNDGLYDAYAARYDTNNDGVYDRTDYYTFNTAGSDKQQKAKNMADQQQGQRHDVSGTIQNAKQVKTRGKDHTVVRIKSSGGDQNTVVADLGTTDKLKSVDFKNGGTIKVDGVSAKVGDKDVLIAHTFDYDGQSHEVDRDRKAMTGKVLSTRTVKTRGAESLIAIVQGVADKDKMAVDLGPKDKLRMDVKKGDRLTFTGVPVKIKNKSMLIAQSVIESGKTVQIDRQPQQANAGGGSGGTGAKS